MPDQRRAPDAEPSEERLPDLEFLALVHASLEEHAPGVTEGARLKGNSLISPHGWTNALLAANVLHLSRQHVPSICTPGDPVQFQPDSSRVAENSRSLSFLAE